MNSVIESGRLTKDPEIRSFPNGTMIARFTLAVDRRFKREDQTADFIQCKCFGKTAEFVEKYFSKGKSMILNGRIETGSYKDKDGKTVYTTEVVAENVEFFGSKTEEEPRPPKAPDDEWMAIPDDADEDLPFA